MLEKAGESVELNPIPHSKNGERDILPVESRPFIDPREVRKPEGSVGDDETSMNVG